MGSEGQTKTFKLIRRNRPTYNNDVIKKNLETLYQNSEKKKHAQDLYYNNNSGISPLKLTRAPVKLRLGRGKVNLPHGTNTSSLLPKPRRSLRRLGKNKKSSNSYSAQNRLTRIKQNHQNMLSTKSFRQRSVPSSIIPSKPQNLTIQVPNQNYRGDERDARKSLPKKFKLMLNPSLQSQITLLQLSAKSVPYQLEHFRAQPVCTLINMHCRFSTL